MGIKGTPMVEPDWAEYAIDDARDWRMKVTQKELEFFNHQRDILRKQGRDEAEMVEIWSQSKNDNGLLHHLDENRAWFEYQLEVQVEVGDGPDPYEKAREEYSRAWLGYVHRNRNIRPIEGGDGCE